MQQSCDFTNQTTYAELDYEERPTTIPLVTTSINHRNKPQLNESIGFNQTQQAHYDSLNSCLGNDEMQEDSILTPQHTIHLPANLSKQFL